MLKPPKVQSLPDVLSLDEIARIILATRERHYQTFWLTAYSMGLRLGETLNLRLGDIDAPARPGACAGRQRPQGSIRGAAQADLELLAALLVRSSASGTVVSRACTHRASSDRGDGSRQHAKSLSPGGGGLWHPKESVDPQPAPRLRHPSDRSRSEPAPEPTPEPVMSPANGNLRLADLFELGRPALMARCGISHNRLPANMARRLCTSRI